MSDTLKLEGDWSFAVRRSVAVDPNLSIGAKALYIAIKAHCGPEQTAFPGVGFLAKALNTTRETIAKYAGELKASGDLRVEQSTGDGGLFRQNVYTIVERPTVAAFDRDGFSPSRSKPSLTNTICLSKASERVPARKPDLPQVPAKLQTSSFLKAWKDWQQHRREIKSPLTPLAASRQLSRLEGWGSERATSAIENSILRGWVGIFEPDATKFESSGKVEKGIIIYGKRYTKTQSPERDSKAYDTWMAWASSN